MKKKSEDHFMYYPTLDDEDFYKNIYLKKEFHKNIIPKQTKTIQELCNPSEFTLLPQQNFLKNYISVDTPYNGVLIFHSVGSGKTCTAITIAEQFKENLKKYKKRILVIVKKGIQKNFIRQIYDLNKEMEKTRKDENVQCTGNTYSLSEEDRYLTKDQKLRKIRSNIKQNYQFVGYEQFANEVLRKTDWNGNLNELTPQIIKKIVREYSNRVIIIDEAHHVNIKGDSEIKKVPPILETIIKYSKNVRLILMSATPMYDKPQEIIYLLNLLLLNDKRQPIKITDVFDKNGIIKETGKKILRDISRGYISYLRGENPITFPIRIYPPEAIVPKIKYDINGVILKPDEKMKYLRLILCNMCDFQYKIYKQILKQTDIIENENKNLDIEDIEDKDITKRNLVYISNIVYPTKTGQIVYAKKGFTTSDDGCGAFYKITQVIDRRKRITFRYQSHVIFNKGTKDEEPFLAKNKIKKYSDKFFEALNYVIDAHGIVFVYSRYLPSGLIPFALMLEQNGIQRYEVDGDKQLLDYHANVKGGGGKERPICYLCGKYASNPIHKPENPKYHKWYAAKYILLTGDKTLTKVDIAKATDLINGKNNEYGQQIKIILGNQAVSEGIDFHRIRQVHILEPWYNVSALEQIIGRAIRNCSHKTLKEDERNVEIYLYASISPKNASEKNKLTETIDEHNYRISELKDIKIKSVERVLKESAIDCLLNKEANIYTKDKIINIITSSGHKMKYNIADKEYSRNCDYQKNCNYKCNWEPPKNKPLKINEDTYNISFAKSDIDLAKRYIKELFKKNVVYDLTDIEKYIKKNLPNAEKKIIYKALDNLIKCKEVLYDRYNREGYLIYRGKYYIFQPREIKDENIPIYYRKVPLTVKTRKLPLVNYVKEVENKNIEEVDKLYDLIKEKIIKFEKLLDKFIKNNNIPMDDTFIILLGMVLDRMKPNEVIYLLKNTINKYNSNKNSLDNIENGIIEHYKNNIFSDSLVLLRTSKVVGEILGFKYHDKYYCIKNNTWSICGEDIRKKLEFITKKKRNEEDKTGNLVGLISYNKKCEVIFQIIDKKKFIEAITIAQKRSKRSEITGRICSTYKIEELNEIKEILGIKSIHKAKKNTICWELEFYFRFKNLNDRTCMWLQNNVSK